MKKKLTRLCCGNCEEFKTHENGWGYCPEIYWPYDINRIKEQSFCVNFVLAKRFRDEYRVDKKSRDKSQCLLERIRKQGIRRRSAMNTSDCVMLTSTSDMSSSNAVSGVDVFCGALIILFFLSLFVYWLAIK